MAKMYSVSLGHATTAGYFTVAKNAASGTEAELHKDQGNGTLVGHVTEGTNDRTFTSAVTGTTAVSIQGASTDETGNWEDAWRITTGAGDDTIMNVGDNSTIHAGNGNNYIETYGTDTTIVTGSGKDTIFASSRDTINSGAGNDLIISDAKDVLINAGDGKDTIAVTYTNNTIQAGSGDDVVGLLAGTNSKGEAFAATDAVVDLGAGDDSVIAYTGTTAKITLGTGKDTVALGVGSDVTLTDYAFGTDVITGLGEVSDMDSFMTSLESGDVFGTSGTVAITGTYTFDDDSSDSGDSSTSASGTTAAASTSTTKTLTTKLTVGQTNGFYAAESTTVEDDGTKTKQAFAWATEDGGMLNVSSYADGAIITGANNGDAADYIIGGSGNDSIVAGANDSVYGGKGNDRIYVDDHAGVTIGLYNDGSNDSVSSANFNLGDGYDDADNTKIYFDGDLGKAKISLNSATSTVTVTNGKSKLFISNEGDPNVTHGTYDTHSAVGFQVTNGASTQNVEVLAKGVSAELLDETTAVFGDGSEIIATNDFGSTVIDLGNTGKYGDTRYYSGITKASLTADNNNDVVLVGAANAANTLVGGAGATSLYGGGKSKDSLVGGTGADTFFYGKGDGRDTVSGYHYDADDATVSDTLVFTTTDLSKITRTDGTLKLTFGTGTNNTLTVTTSDEVDTAVAYTTSGEAHLAKIGNTKAANSFTYDSTVNYYQGGKESDTLVVAGEEDANIWLDGSTGVTYSSIENVTATGSGNVTLAGGSASEQISAGSGDASLWGGIGGNDTLTGGTGTNTFFFGKNNGSDVVTSTSETDRVMLYDVALSDVKSFGETNGAMVIALNDGSKLTVNSVASGTTFQTTDGAWSYDTTTQSWTQA